MSQGEPCDICGGVGGANYQELMVTCTRCRTAQVHVYCHFNFPEVSGEWVCESCRSRDVVSLEDGAKEDMLRTMPQDSSTRACHDNIQLSPSSVRQTCSEREIKPVECGKVKYISLDEVKMLSAAAAFARSNSGPKPGSSSSMIPLWNSLAGSRAAASKSSASMVKSNRSLGPSDLVKPPRHGGGVRSMVNQQVPQTSKKLKDGNFRDVDETDLLNVLPKFGLYHFNLLAVDATWNSKEKMNCLCELMEVHKSMMKSCVDGVELLIFTSKDLYLVSQSELSLPAVAYTFAL